MAKKKQGRPSPKFLTAILVLIIAILFVAFLEIPKPRNQETGVPAEIIDARSSWPMANRDYANTRATFDAKINSKNVSSLGLAWSVPITGKSDWGAITSNPIILGNTVYFQDLKSNIYAVHISDGSLKWRKDYNLDNIGPNGVSLGYGKIFAAKGHYEVVALDLNGKELWSTRLSNRDTLGIDIQTSVYNGLVFVSTVPGISNQNFYKGGDAGIIYALDQNTGKIRWSFDTVDSKDIWGNSTVNSGGGAWYPPAIDVMTGKMFFGVGNPAPFPGTKDFPNGSSRPGNNLYTDSLISLDGNTGKLEWYRQVTPHDLFDYDFEASPILVANGSGSNMVIGAGKAGKVVAFNRDGGQILWETKVGIHQNDDLTTLPNNTTRVYPGPLGGVETPMAYADGVVYVPVVNLFADYTPAGLIVKTFNTAAGTGELNAVDIKSGTILWRVPFKTAVYGAATVVNDLVFTSTFDGTIYALRRSNGEILWEYKATGGINGWPAVVGDTILIPVGLGKTPQLIALKLGAASVTPAPNKAQSPQAVETGKIIHMRNFQFEPKVLTIPLGTKVTWVNDDSAVHTVNSDWFNSRELSTGGTFDYVFTQKGTFDYSCNIHPGMVGTIRVI